MKILRNRLVYLVLAIFFMGTTGVPQEVINDGVLSYLLTNREYTLDPNPDDTLGISPIIGGKEYGQPVMIELLGAPGALVHMSFALPSALGNASGDSIPCYFGPTSAFTAPAGVFWDADSGMVIALDGDGYAMVSLGITVTVPDTAPNTSYIGAVECWASHVPTESSASPGIPLRVWQRRSIP